MFWVIYKQSGRTGTEWAKIHFKTKLKRIMHKCKLSSTSKIKHTGKLSFIGKLFRWMLRNICKRIQFLEVRWSFFSQHLTLSIQKQSRYVLWHSIISPRPRPWKVTENIFMVRNTQKLGLQSGSSENRQTPPEIWTLILLSFLVH